MKKYIHPLYKMFSTIGKDSTVNTTIGYESFLSDIFDEPTNVSSQQQDKMIHDIQLCYGGAGAAFAGTPTSFCHSSSNSGFSDDPNASIKQLYIASITVVGLFILFRILQRSY